MRFALAAILSLFNCHKMSLTQNGDCRHAIHYRVKLLSNYKRISIEITAVQRAAKTIVEIERASAINCYRTRVLNRAFSNDEGCDS